MYRILVIDDEELITDSLAGLLEETSLYDLDVYKAYSGSEALRFLNEFQIDIVVSDISMPGITGIELAKSIREKWPLCQVILLTGYDDFKYAQQAIRHKVTCYILKSEGDDVLLDAIGDCIRSIEHDTSLQDTLLKAKEENRLSKATLRRSLTRALLFGQNRQTLHQDQAFEQIDISLESNQPIMLLAGKISQELTDEMALAIDIILKEKINYAVKSESVWMGRNVIIWALQPVEPDNLQHAQAVIKGMAEGFKRTVRHMLNVSISFIFHEKLMEWECATQPFENLKLIAVNQLESSSELALAGIEYFEDKNSSLSEKSFVNRLMAYIQEHLDGDLSLCTLSDKLHLNPSYLSRRFKELTGRTLSEVILELRMKTACDLLKTTSYRISEIAQMVGYETAANFSKVFKKEMKMTPREYRDGEGTLR